MRILKQSDCSSLFALRRALVMRSRSLRISDAGSCSKPRIDKARNEQVDALAPD